VVKHSALVLLLATGTWAQTTPPTDLERRILELEDKMRLIDPAFARDMAAQNLAQRIDALEPALEPRRSPGPFRRDAERHLRVRMLAPMRRGPQPHAREHRCQMRLAASLLLAGLCFSQTGRPTLPGSPMAGLSPSEQERFRIGLADFTDVETAEDGLGPAFNGHIAPFATASRPSAASVR
jgi:hypothetical protein